MHRRPGFLARRVAASDSAQAASPEPRLALVAERL